MTIRIGITLAFLLLVVWVFAMLPAWLKDSDSDSPEIDWSQVVDDPDEHLTFTLVESATYQDAMMEENAYIKEVLEKRFNVTLNYTSIDPVSYNRKGPLSWAAGLIPDIFVQASSLLGSETRHGFLVAAVKHGFIIPVPLEVIAEHAPTYARMIDNYADVAWISGTVNNRNYQLPQINPDAVRPNIGMWRKDWLAAVGIDKIPDTIEDYTLAFQRFKTGKPDAENFLNAFGGALNDAQKQQVLNEVKPTWGMSGDILNWRAGMFNPIFGAYDVQPFHWGLIDGEIQWGGIQEKSRRALETLRDWYQAGYIHPDFTQDHRTREEFQKFYSGITGHMSHWAFYIELHPDRIRIQTAGKLQRDRDRDMLIRLGKSESEIEDLLAGAAERYRNLWAPAAVPAGPQGHRGQRVSGALGTESRVFGRQVAEQPQKVLRWLRMIETALNDEALMVQLTLGKEGLHWRWQPPATGNEQVRDEVTDEKLEEEYGLITHSAYPESTTVSLPPYDTWMKRIRQGLVYDLWSSDLYSLLGISAPVKVQQRYQSKEQSRWAEKYRKREHGDQCIFGDAELLAPLDIAADIKRLITFQQSAYAAFIKGERNLAQWEAFVSEFQQLGGEVVTRRMRERYGEMQLLNTKVDAMLNR